ncbi:MAG: substrate-binding domain-containing protein [Dethiobacter sp.]|nr:substrate-binding domain-containing protein [Dethiobacter sp.]MBS3901256.1 substrate-binding domain-containing protein [Dethiobacter sp.]MBS3989081.1 substrate-binding domain-containing protein [Dethiobacter sp.]
MSKRLSSWLLGLFLLLFVMTAANGFASAAEIRVLLDGRPLSMEVKPQLEGGTVLVPLRAVLGAFGAEMHWDGRTRSVSISRGRANLGLTIGSTTASINGVRTQLDVAPRIVNGRTLVPLRFVSESLGSQVDWRSRDLTVAIARPAKRQLTLATTTSTYDSGLLQAMLPVFENAFDYDVRIISVGTGAALALGRDGNADVVLVHSRELELQNVAQGHFIGRREVMYNDFVIVGPAADTAGIRRAGNAAAALRAIAVARATFVSRGDNSGTHVKENELWRAVGLTPSGAWYLRAGAGMADTLRMADERNGYTLTDRGTFYMQQEKLDLALLFEGGESLHNQYGIMAVNPARHARINFDGATDLIQFFVSRRGQALVADFKDARGRQLFFPNANLLR